MLKNKFKMVIVLFTVISLVSFFCVTVKATDGSSAINNEAADTPQLISENPNEENSNNAEDNTSTEDTILYDDLYIAEDSVVMDKTVDGNVYIVGNDVKITGKVNGNLFVCGQNVEFTSPYPEDDTEHADENYCYVAGNVYAVANNLTFNAIAQDLYAACSNFNMSYKSYIMRDVRLFAADSVFKGYVTRNAYIAGNSIDFGTPSENEDENDAAFINGNLHYSLPSEMEIPESIVVGETTFTVYDDSEDTDSSKTVADYLMNLLDVLIYTIVIYLLITWLAPKFFERTSVILKTSALSTAGIGILAIILPVIAGIILLCLTLASLSFTLFTVYGLLLAISYTVVVGSLTYLLKDKIGFANKKFLLLIIVTIILWGLKQIPFAGPIITFVISIFGMGLIINNIFKKNKPLELNEQNK